jgi:hypothetical protein
MVKPTSQVINELMAASLIQTTSIFKLAATVDSLKLTIIIGSTLDNEQRRALIQFLHDCDINHQELGDKEIIEMALKEIDTKYDFFYLSLRYGDEGVDLDEFDVFNDTIYNSSKQVIKMIEPRVNFSNAECTDLRIETALKLMDELNKLENLFGEKARFEFKDRMFKNQHQAPLPEFVVEEIASNRSGHT